jgi:superfamily II DNA/RNA helicase
VQGFSLRQLQHLVLDEADRILSLDFEEDIDKILKVRASTVLRAVLRCCRVPGD